MIPLSENCMSKSAQNNVEKDLTASINDAEDRLKDANSINFAKMDFDWRGGRFRATSDVDAMGQPGIGLSGRLGRLFFTAEGPTMRQLALAKVCRVNSGVDGRYEVKRSGAIKFSNRTATSTLLTGHDLVEAITIIILDADSHLRDVCELIRPEVS